MAPRRAYATGYTYMFPAGSYTFRPPVAGKWKFVLWGPGGASGGSPGASGAYCEYTRLLTPADAVSLVVSRAKAPGAGAADATTATFAGGKVVSAGGATDGTAGVASGGDVNLNGSASGVAGLGTGGGAADSGGGAPANLPYRGGAGGSAASAIAAVPGYPGAGAGNNGTIRGSDGLVLVVLDRVPV
jgi:hypothetical protein